MNQQIRNGPHFKISTYFRRGLKRRHLQHGVEIHNLKIAKYLHIYFPVQSASGYFVHLKIESWRNGSFICLCLTFFETFFTEFKSYKAKKYIPRPRVRDQ